MSKKIYPCLMYESYNMQYGHTVAMRKCIHYITVFDEQTENMPKRRTQCIRLNEASHSAIC